MQHYAAPPVQDSRHGVIELMRALRRGERVHDAILRDLRRSAAVCVRLLTDDMKTHLGEEPIHEVRTRIKKMRSLLRLVRPELGETNYQRTKRLLQQATMPLARVRDSAVILTTCDGLTRDWSRTDHACVRAILERSVRERGKPLSGARRRSIATGLSKIHALADNWSGTDMTIVRQAARAGESGEAGPLCRRLAQAAARQQQSLRRRSRKIAFRVYKKPPDDFVKWLHRDWRRWRAH